MSEISEMLLMARMMESVASSLTVVNIYCCTSLEQPDIHDTRRPSCLSCRTLLATRYVHAMHLIKLSLRGDQSGRRIQQLQLAEYCTLTTILRV